MPQIFIRFNRTLNWPERVILGLGLLAALVLFYLFVFGAFFAGIVIFAYFFLWTFCGLAVLWVALRLIDWWGKTRRRLPIIRDED